MTDRAFIVTEVTELSYDCDYSIIEEAVDKYVNRVIVEGLRDLYLMPFEDEPVASFERNVDGVSSGVLLNFDGFVKDLHRLITMDAGHEGGIEHKMAKTWHDFFVDSAKKLEPYIEERSDA